MKTNVLFDYQCFSSHTMGGIDTYHSILLERLQKEEYDIHARCLSTIYVSKSVDSSHLLGPSIRVPRVPKTIFFIKHFNHIITQSFAHRFKPDIYHQTYSWPTAPTTLDCKCKRVLTVHDLIHEKYPQYYGKNDKTKEMRARSIEESDHIVCVSENTRLDLLSFYRVPERKVSVIYNGTKRFEETDTENGKMDTLVDNKPYVLYVGSRRRYKNFVSLARAIASDKRLLGTISLVLAGGEEMNGEDRRMLSELGLSRLTKHIRPSDNELGMLYRNAAAHVCTSLYEGFGLTIAEAMNSGCPVITGKGGALQDIAGTAAIFVDTEKPGEIAEAIVSCLDNQPLRQSLRAAGIQNSKRFDWDACSKQTAALYKSLALG